jgi:hypothetical protein
MRIFLGIILFDMVYSNIGAFTPVSDWCAELGMPDLPRGLPGPQERAELARTASDDNPHPVRDRVQASFASFGEYFTPWPGAAVRQNINTPLDGLKFAHCWIATRLRFFENLALARQGWTMFAPNVRNWDVVHRARLVYADGSTRTIRSIAEPINLARQEDFRGFLSEKRVEYSTGLDDDGDARRGYCNLLAHRHAVNDAGSPLVIILLIRVHYEYPKPALATREALERQVLPLGEERNTPCYRYDVRARTGSRTSWWTQLFSG